MINIKSRLTISILLFYYELFLISTINAIDNGIWEWENKLTTNDEHPSYFLRSLFKNFKLFIRIDCQSNKKNSNVTVEWILTELECWEKFLTLGNNPLSKLQLDQLMKELKNDSHFNIKLLPKQYHCTDSITTHINSSAIFSNEASNINAVSAVLPKELQVSKQPEDDMYFLLIIISNTNDLNVTIHVEMKGDYGYLSAKDWPLLPFYKIMCIVYIIFAILWLTVSFLQWKDLLRIQLWIGAVILIGMIEKAMFLEMYQSVNNTGKSSLIETLFIAEIISVFKRTLARMLVIIVSLGYGIVKPRLGSHLPKIYATGFIYFVLAIIEARLKVSGPLINHLFIPFVLLALLDSFICWWIFSNLLQTTRTLRLRRNLVKLTLYNHFTVALIFAVIASAVYMSYAIKVHKIDYCYINWRYLWLDDAYWHALFSIILLVIMILWRPTNNNQRYAFSPLLDAPEDDDDDDEEIEHFINDAYGVKMRGLVNNRNEYVKPKTPSAEDDLKWVEENIPPSLIDTALPILDSDEDIMNTKFEISKME